MEGLDDSSTEAIPVNLEWSEDLLRWHCLIPPRALKGALYMNTRTLRSAKTPLRFLFTGRSGANPPFNRKVGGQRLKWEILFVHPDLARRRKDRCLDVNRCEFRDLLLHCRCV